MANNDIKMLRQAILDYLVWVDPGKPYRGKHSNTRYRQILIDFLFFAIDKEITWKEMFTIDTLNAFQTDSGLKGASRALIALSGYLFTHGLIDQPLQIPKPQIPLPDIYEHYLIYHDQTLQTSHSHLGQVRRLLSRFHEYLESREIKLSEVKIEQLDTFMAQFKVAHSTGRIYRSHLRGFLKYLYHERSIIKKDLASLLLGPTLYAQTKPPRFLRSEEVQKLFASLKLSTPVDIRTYAMVHLAYTLGLRPVEISRITLDDISFRKGEITLQDRKGDKPIILPIPEKTLKAVGAYVIKSRPKTPSRHLFLNFQFPYRPISAVTVIYYISRVMKQAGLKASSYWLRHTYAQNLLLSGQSIYEIKEMLGHQNIQSTTKYLQIHTELMRKVLFDEEL